MSSETDWILVTGQPSCGKTTAVKKIMVLLQQHGFHCRGFYTDEVLLPGGTRSGFDIITVPDGKRGKLSRKGGPSKLPKTGSYSVFVDSFEELVLPTLGPCEGDGGGAAAAAAAADNDDGDDGSKVVYILDEIGRMELHSSKFPLAVRALLDKGVRLVGALTAPRYGHRVPFCDEVEAVKGVQVHKLKKSTRDTVVASLMRDVTTRWIETSGHDATPKRTAELSETEMQHDSRMLTKRRRTGGEDET